MWRAQGTMAWLWSSTEECNYTGLWLPLTCSGLFNSHYMETLLWLLFNGPLAQFTFAPWPAVAVSFTKDWASTHRGLPLTSADQRTRKRTQLGNTNTQYTAVTLAHLSTWYPCLMVASKRKKIVVNIRFNKLHQMGLPTYCTSPHTHTCRHTQFQLNYPVILLIDKPMTWST